MPNSPAGAPGRPFTPSGTGALSADHTSSCSVEVSTRPQVWNTIGLFILAFTGLSLGLGLPAQSSLPWPYDRIAQVAGWSYFAAWSLSFYPQAISNYQRKSVVGFSLDFAVLNFVGFACLSIYYAAFAWSPLVRAQYRQVYGADNSVRINDVFFALHAAALTGFTLGQCIVYDRGQQAVSRTCKHAVVAIAAVVLLYAIIVVVSNVGVLGWLYMLSLIKVGITTSKYIPQILLNLRRRSTIGWSVEQVIMDVTGGMLSMLQLGLEAIVLRELSLVTGDPVKFLLAFVSLGYDTVLLIQHYCLYAWHRQGFESRSLKAQTSDDREVSPDSC